MLTMNLGPIALPTNQLVLMMAMVVALFVGHLVGQRKIGGGIGNVLIDMTLIALLVARITFVAIWFETYRSSLWSAFDIRDGGFSLWAGVLAALLVALWHGWRRATLRIPLILGLAAGAFAWGVMSALLSQLERPDLPKVSLTTLSGEPADLAALAGGKPMVINLWATWCPPCRNEMPVLAAAQQRETGVQFVFVDQGEDGTTVKRYLAASGLELANVLLDSGAHFGREVGSMGLPTTLFYDANGRMVDTNVGALSTATLTSKLNRLRKPTETSNKK